MGGRHRLHLFDNYSPVQRGTHGSSFSETVSVSAGGIVETQPGSSGAWANAPGQLAGQSLTLAGWAQALGYFIKPGEGVILHADDEAVTNARCGHKG